MIRFRSAQSHQGEIQGSQNLRAKCATAAVLAVMAYLSLVNLDYAPFWHDEAASPTIARNLLALGSPTADDGRNVLSHFEGKDLRDDLTLRHPPLSIYMQAAVFRIFGVGEVQARTLMALFTLAAMLLFLDILRREFPGRSGFVALVMMFACLSPITLGYARSATYNSPLLFFNILLFWSYLRFCERPQLRFALLTAAAAVASFHTHYLGSGVFVAALGIFHLLFRRSCFDRRAWLVMGSVAIGYGLLAARFLYAEYSTGGYIRNEEFSIESIWWHMLLHIASLNMNLILVWPVALWLILLLGYRMLFAPSSEHDGTGGRSYWQTLRDDRIFQYFVLAVSCAIILAPWAAPPPFINIRYIAYIAPFAAIVTAAAVAWAWRCSRLAGGLAGAILLLSNLGGWPLLGHAYYHNSPLPTLPALAVEYHYDYPDPSREAFAYLREHARQDEIIWVPSEVSFRTTHYLSDKFLICCILRKETTPKELQNGKRSYLFKDNIENGTVKPDWILFYGEAPETPLIKYGDWHYQLVQEFSEAYLTRHYPQRPEPALHAAFPLPYDDARNRMRFYRAVPHSGMPEMMIHDDSAS